MSVKKTISLQEDVAIAAMRKAKLMCNGNLSNYINSIIYNANKDEIDELQRSKPKKCGNIFEAIKMSRCEYCSKTINIGDKICNATYLNGHSNYTHVNCSKE